MPSLQPPGHVRGSFHVGSPVTPYGNQLGDDQVERALRLGQRPFVGLVSRYRRLRLLGEPFEARRMVAASVRSGHAR